MAPLVHMASCSIIEKDDIGDILWTWAYPEISESQKNWVMRKCNVQSEPNNSLPFMYDRRDFDWFYVHWSDILDSEKNLPRVKQFAIVVFAKEFEPQKYETLCRVLSKSYQKTGSPTEILRLYLSVFTKGSCTTLENGTFVVDECNQKFSLSSSNVRELIRAFELETILIYTALLLKKRIIVYHHSLEQLLKWMRTFPALMKHREVTNHLFPWVELSQDDLSELRNHSYYIAGCKDSSISSRTELYDLLVNLPATEITVAAHAKESLTMTKTHKEIAMFLVQLCENSYTETQVVSEITEKTQDLLSQLKNLATDQGANGNNMVSAQTIRDKNLTPAVEHFLINLAVAEKLFVS